MKDREHVGDRLYKISTQVELIQDMAYSCCQLGPGATLESIRAASLYSWTEIIVNDLSDIIAEISKDYIHKSETQKEVGHV